MKRQENAREVWKWIRAHEGNAKIIIEPKPITDSYGSEAIEWRFTAGKDKMKFLTKRYYINAHTE